MSPLNSALPHINPQETFLNLPPPKISFKFVSNTSPNVAHPKSAPNLFPKHPQYFSLPKINPKLAFNTPPNLSHPKSSPNLSQYIFQTLNQGLELELDFFLKNQSGSSSYTA
jgi:hypothetical protein